MLYVDIPTSADIRLLTAFRGDMCVSIYLPTTPVTPEAQADRIALKNLAKQAVEQLQEAGADKRRVAALAEQLDDLAEDAHFWRFQAHSLAVFATPESLRTFRVASKFEPIAAVSDRFHLKPLLRSISFPNACYVLALAAGSVRLVEVSPDLPPAPVEVAGMPEDAGRALNRLEEGDRPPRYSPIGRIHEEEGRKVLLRQFARQVDQALRPLLTGSEIPLVLAATEPLASIYRSVNSYADLAEAMIEGNPEALTDAQLADRARPILDGIYRDKLAAWRTLFEERENQGRATTDLAQTARAATFGAVDSLLVDIDETLPGHIDEEGRITFAEQEGATSYGVGDEIASRVIMAGGRVLGVRKADIPGGQPLAAILRYPI